MPEATKIKNGRQINAEVDCAFDAMLATLGCSQDNNDAVLISHWQDGLGYRLQVSRKADQKTLTRLIALA